MPYSDDGDLKKKRPNILQYGISSFVDQQAEAESDINRALDSGWYRREADSRAIDWRATPFDSDNLLNAVTELKKLSVYKTLAIAYDFLSKNQDDMFSKESIHFMDMYDKELKEILTAGLSYDFDGDSTIDSTESKLSRQPRRLSLA